MSNLMNDLSSPVYKKNHLINVFYVVDNPNYRNKVRGFLQGDYLRLTKNKSFENKFPEYQHQKRDAYICTACLGKGIVAKDGSPVTIMNLVDMGKVMQLITETMEMIYKNNNKTVRRTQDTANYIKKLIGGSKKLGFWSEIKKSLNNNPDIDAMICPKCNGNGYLHIGHAEDLPGMVIMLRTLYNILLKQFNNPKGYLIDYGMVKEEYVKETLRTAKPQSVEENLKQVEKDKAKAYVELGKLGALVKKFKKTHKLTKYEDKSIYDPDFLFLTSTGFKSWTKKNKTSLNTLNIKRLTLRDEIIKKLYELIGKTARKSKAENVVHMKSRWVHSAKGRGSLKDTQNQFEPIRFRRRGNGLADLYITAQTYGDRMGRSQKTSLLDRLTSNSKLNKDAVDAYEEGNVKKAREIRDKIVYARYYSDWSGEGYRPWSKSNKSLSNVIYKAFLAAYKHMGYDFDKTKFKEFKRYIVVFGERNG
jgi:Skp family chaperone for outer membrane proteins